MPWDSEGFRDGFQEGISHDYIHHKNLEGGWMESMYELCVPFVLRIHVQSQKSTREVVLNFDEL